MSATGSGQDSLWVQLYTPSASGHEVPAGMIVASGDAGGSGPWRPLRALDVCPNADLVICAGPEVKLSSSVVPLVIRLMAESQADALFLSHSSRHCIYTENFAQVGAVSGEDQRALIERGASLRDRNHPVGWGLFESDVFVVRRSEGARRILQIWEQLGGDMVSLPTALLTARDAKYLVTSKLSFQNPTQFTLLGSLTHRLTEHAEHTTIITPCKGRPYITTERNEEIRQSAGVPCESIFVVDGDPEAAEKLIRDGRVRVIVHEERRGYWQALATATESSNGKYLVNLANDLMSGREWLRRALDVYKECFECSGRDGDGIVGFNDGIHTEAHSSHMLISRSYLKKLGGWPVWYDHNFGDTELCTRAQAEGRYVKAPYSVLYHRHWLTAGQKIFDEVYAEGIRSHDVDARLFDLRRQFGWPMPEDETKFRASFNMSRAMR